MRVSFTGELTVTTTASVKSQMVTALCQQDAVEADCRAVTEVDVAGLQLLLSFRRSVRELGHAFSLPVELRSPALVSVLADAGLESAFDVGAPEAR
jgi:ABC-type transporter Mla MlaB component